MLRETSRESLRKFCSQLVGYGAVSAVALGADVTVLKFLVEDAGWHYLAASGIAFTAGATIAYALSVRFVFAERRLSRRSFEFGSFVALGLVGLAVNAGALFLAVSTAGLDLITAKLFAAACTFATNFTLRRQLLFAPSRAS